MHSEYSMNKAKVPKEIGTRKKLILKIRKRHLKISCYKMRKKCLENLKHIG